MQINNIECSTALLGGGIFISRTGARFLSFHVPNHAKPFDDDDETRRDEVAIPTRTKLEITHPAEISFHLGSPNLHRMIVCMKEHFFFGWKKDFIPKTLMQNFLCISLVRTG